ncbi:hypothetical protein GCM10023188_29340 [Pontibacter saemangeumensis]|uniref:Lipoprotein n=1 Tax=Pontibacter saemangeumensis TaxID=1084525 RepID=A0ABP8LTP8_9BACT
MKKVFSAFLCTLLLILLFSCDRENEVAPVEETLPLQVGNEWVYEVTDFDTSAKPLTKSSYRNSVIRDTLIHRSTWYILSSGSIVQNSKEGYVYYNEAGDQPVMIYQCPGYGGIGYMYEYPGYEMWVLTTRSQQPDTITAAAETYASYLFSIEKQYISPNNAATNTLKQHDYVAPDIGLVRSDRYYVNSDNVMQRHELVRYTLR